MSAQALLSVHNLYCQRGDKRLFSDISFTVHAGHCWHIVGSNGSGKTSLLRQLVGLLDGTQQRVAEMVQWQQSESAARSIGFAYLGHSDGLKPELTALENLTFYANFCAAQEASSMLKSADDLDEYLFRVGILECADLPTRNLSFGQRRRLSLARVLLSGQAVWLLDEPLTGIDAAGRELFTDLFMAHLQGGGAILLTHHQNLSGSRLSPHLQELHLS